MQQYDMEKNFDGIYHKTIPLILFSFLEDQKCFADLLSSLYDAMYRNDEVSFQEIYNKLENKINERNSFGSHKENLIKSFGDRFLSLDQRIRNIDKVFLDFKSMKEQINKDHINLKNLAKTSRSHGAFIREFKKQSLQNKKNENVVIDDVLRFDKEKIDKQDKKQVSCPNCGRIINTKQDIGRKTYCRGCKKTFKIEKFRGEG